MKEKKKFGFNSQAYAAPRAESIEMSNEGLLCASQVVVSGGLEGFQYKDNPLGSDTGW